MLTSKQYWQERQELKYLSGEQKVNDYYSGLKKSFEQAKKDIQSVINDFYWRYAQENGVTYASAQILLSKTELGELQDFIDKVKANMGKYDQELNNMSIRARLTRYEALQKQVDALLQQLYAVDYQYNGEQLMKDIYTESYYRSWYNIDQYHGFHQEFAQVSTQAIEELITYPFDGADFSTRLWKQKDHMLQQLNESITTMLIQGRNPQTLAKDFAKKFERKEFEAYRLLHTEGSFIMEQASQAAYKEDGVEKYQWLATLDINTCERCREKDGKHFDVEKAVIGVNMPPLHSFDRCTTVPYYDDQDMTGRTRIARDPVTGKGYEVPADMTYKQWHKEFIQGNPEAEIVEMKWKNRHVDKRQYENYKNILGTDAPKTLDDFQNLKYTEIEKYGFVKLSYSRRKLLLDNPELTLPGAEKAVLPESKFTKYLFSETNLKGRPKGEVFNSRLGYNSSNWIELRDEIQNNINKYPAVFKNKIEFGDLYEQKMVLMGKKGTPANVIIGWIKKPDGTVSMTTAYIKEVN